LDLEKIIGGQWAENGTYLQRKKEESEVCSQVIRLREKFRFLRHPHHKKHKLTAKRRRCGH